ncbi:hypothetical protein KM043_005341 [Ampulex compressa]|nr:hypothetical protein KM043_005341 [Ampulex compressa]
MERPARDYRLTLLVILALCTVTATLRPDILPDDDQIIKKERDSLEIVCTGFQRMQVFYPVDVGDSITTSRVEIEEHEENGIWRYVIRRRETIHGDTGWYGCGDVDIPSKSATRDNTEISWVYVYVTSNVSVFVQEDSFVSLLEVSGGTTIIPCRPTSPEFKVVLWNADNLAKEEAPYDPRVGFTLENLTVKHSGTYKCLIKYNDTDHGVNYHLLVLQKQPLSYPKINDDTLRHVTRGQTLYVNCTVEVDSSMRYVLNWSTPIQSPRISSRPRDVEGLNIRQAVTELIIENVQNEDEGEYECIISSFHDSKSTKKLITIHDPDVKYINLTSQDVNRHYPRRYGDRVQWVVYVDSYPPVTLRWLNPKGDDIEASWSDPERAKYAIKTTASSTILRINRLNVNNMGVYTLQASNKHGIETLNFTLDVMSKPIPILDSLEFYYAPNDTVEVHCYIGAFPSPNVTWHFLKCPNYPSYENSTTVLLNNSIDSGVVTSFVSKVKMTIEYSGHLTCTACNTLGCDSATETIFVSDGKQGFGIIEPKNAITEGDTLELICAASKYNYTNIIQWFQENDDVPLSRQQSDRLQITSKTTPFTYRSILKIKNVQKSQSKNYNCIGNTTDGIMEEKQYFLQVHDTRMPYFTDTNMNRTELNINLNTDRHKRIIFKCFAEGMPKPLITWYKDNTILKSGDQYSFYYNNQELHIESLLDRDGGKYLCRAHNRLGNVETYHFLRIKGSGKDLPTGLIVSIVILVILVVVLIIFFSIRVHREKVMRKELIEAGLMHFEEGALECLNPELTVDDQAELLPYDKKWEFPRERLKLGKQLGSGAFGVVMKAEAEGICEEETITTVAVKMVRRTTDPTYVRALASELKIMVHLGKHLNVVNLLGACTKNISKRELLVIVEYCRFGNLHNYLLRHRADFINQIDPTTGKFDPTIGIDLLTRTVSVSSNNSLSVNSGTDSVQYCQGTTTDSQGISMSPEGCVLSNNSTQPGWRSNYRGDYKDHNLKPICTQDLLSWAFQVARGMEYLSQRNVLHGDLAARNILLAENNIVKICDFGLAKTMYKDGNYKKKGDGPLPIKWMAIESIRDRVFSTQSDIWSFGIVLWEFFTLAETPYPGMEAEKQYQKLIEGYRMEQPEYATADVYNIMLQCWKAKPTLRPSFTELVESIGDQLEESVRAHYVSLNTPYMDMNTMILESGKNDYLTMMSAPDHAALSSPTHDYVNSPVRENPSDSAYLCMSPTGRMDESGIFSPRPEPEKSHFEFPTPTSDSEDAVELSPMLKKEEDPYLKPINVHERRAEFARQRQALKNQTIDDRPIERDSEYCNAPRNLHLIDLSEKSTSLDDDEVSDVIMKKNFLPPIIRTQDNYVNMPKQKSDLRKDMPDGFSNPSYVMMNNREVEQSIV